MSNAQKNISHLELGFANFIWVRREPISKGWIMNAFKRLLWELHYK